MWSFLCLYGDFLVILCDLVCLCGGFVCLLYFWTFCVFWCLCGHFVCLCVPPGVSVCLVRQEVEPCVSEVYYLTLDMNRNRTGGGGGESMKAVSAMLEGQGAAAWT